MQASRVASAALTLCSDSSNIPGANAIDLEALHVSVSGEWKIFQGGMQIDLGTFLASAGYEQKFLLSNMQKLCEQFYFPAKKPFWRLLAIEDTNYSFYHIISSFATSYLPYHAIILMFVLYIFNFNNL